MTSQHIRDILRGGERIDTPSVSVYAAPASPGEGQVACVVGKKVHASAVIRHRYQRLLRAASREILMPAASYDIVIVAKPAILSLEKMPELKSHLEPHLKKFISHANPTP